jgi:hypothetical protein
METRGSVGPPSAALLPIPPKLTTNNTKDPGEHPGVFRIVETRGIEPLTSALQRRPR